METIDYIGTKNSGLLPSRAGNMYYEYIETLLPMLIENVRPYRETFREGMCGQLYSQG